MNKNSILNLLTVIMVIVLNVGYVSCSKDSNNDKDDNNSNTYNVVGTWVGYACVNGNTKEFDWDDKLTLVFNADGTGKYLEDPPLNHKNVECTFLYEMEGSKRGKAYISAMKTNIWFEIIDNNMIVYYGAGFGSDIDYYLTKQ